MSRRWPSEWELARLRKRPAVADGLGDMDAIGGLGDQSKMTDEEPTALANRIGGVRGDHKFSSSGSPARQDAQERP